MWNLPPMLEENDRISLPLIHLLSFSPGSVLLLVCFALSYHVSYSSGCIIAELVRLQNTSSGVAQWLACWAHNPEVRGLKPRSAILTG